MNKDIYYKNTNIKKDNNFKRYLIIKYEKHLSSKIRSSAKQTITSFGYLQEVINRIKQIHTNKKSTYFC